MAIRIEIRYVEHSKAWQIRVGDLSGSTESYNITQNEVIEEIKDLMKEAKNINQDKGVKE